MYSISRSFRKNKIVFILVFGGCSLTAIAESWGPPIISGIGAPTAFGSPTSGGSGGGQCRFGGGGSDTSVLECADGVYSRGGDGVFRRAGGFSGPAGPGNPVWGGGSVDNCPPGHEGHDHCRNGGPGGGSPDPGGSFDPEPGGQGGLGGSPLPRGGGFGGGGGGRGGTCTYGNGGTDTNILECPEGRYFRGPDGIFRAGGGPGPGPGDGGGRGSPFPGGGGGGGDGGGGGLGGGDDGDGGAFDPTVPYPGGPGGPPIGGAPGIPGGSPGGAPGHDHGGTGPGGGRRPASPLPPVPGGGGGSPGGSGGDGGFGNSFDSSPELQGAVAKCIACHSRQPQLLQALKDPRTILPHLAAMNDGTLNDMVGRARLTPKQDHAIREFVRKARTEPAPGGGGNRNIASTVPACYMRPEEAGKRAGGLPNIDNSSQMATFLSQAKEGGRMMFYDRGAVPRTWLSGSINGTTPRLLTNRNATNPFMMDRMGYHSDGAREHPWLHTAGLDSSPNGTADKFIIPPTGGPMMRLGQRTRGNSPSYFGTSTNVNGPNMGWVYNPGTTFGEVLKVSGVAFEIRLRRKTASGWQMDVLRPFGSPQELADGIRRVCGQTGAPSGCGQLNGAAEQIQAGTARLTNRSEFINAQAFQTRRDPLRLSKTAAEATQPTAMLQELPDLPPDVVKALLTTTPFKSVMNRPWIAGPPASWAPTTKSNFNIVPKNYFAGFIPLTQDACMKCHDSTGRHVDNFDPLPSQMFAPLPTDAQRPRTWYDHLPGDDGILSFHPFDANSVAQGAAATRGAINQCLLRNGLAQ